MGTHRGGHNCHDRQEQARHGVLGGWRWSAWKGGQIFRAYVLTYGSRRLAPSRCYATRCTGVTYALSLDNDTFHSNFKVPHLNFRVHSQVRSMLLNVHTGSS